MLQIIDARIEHVPGILKIYNHAIATSTATFDLNEQTLEERKEWFSHYGGRYPLIVAEQDGEVVGYSSLSRFRDKQAYSKTAESSVYIDERYQGRGIGRTLVTEILKRAADAGFHVVIAGITGGNEASEKLHEKLGFQPIGIFREVGFKFDVWQDVHFYQRFL